MSVKSSCLDTFYSSNFLRSILTDSIFQVQVQDELAIGLRQFSHAIDAKRPTQAVNVGIVDLVRLRLVRIGEFTFLIGIPCVRARREFDSIGELNGVFARRQALDEHTEMAQLTDAVQFRLDNHAPFVIGVEEYRRFDLGVDRLSRLIAGDGARAGLRHVRVLRIGQLRRDLHVGDVGEKKILDLQFALNVAALVHEVDRAEPIDRRERLAAVQRDFIGEFTVLLRERFVAREMFST